MIWREAVRSVDRDEVRQVLEEQQELEAPRPCDVDVVKTASVGNFATEFQDRNQAGGNAEFINILQTGEVLLTRRLRGERLCGSILNGVKLP